MKKLLIFFVGILFLFSCNKELQDDVAYFESVDLCNGTWMLKNLDVKTYRNGDPIPQVTDNATWLMLNTGAWCWYNNDSATYAAIYGRLYNWWAVNDRRGLAPRGWHVPTTTEWQSVIDCLGGEAVAGAALKEAGTTHWLSPNTGANNSSGFTGLPVGGRFGSDGSFINNGMYCDWWSATPVSVAVGKTFYVGKDSASVKEGGHLNYHGFSVRCKKD